MRRSAVVAGGVLGALFAALSPAAVARVAPAPPSAAITIQDGACSPPSGSLFCYNPPSQSAAAGEQVTWTNGSGAPHTITRCTPSACSGVGGGTGTDSWAGSSTVNPSGTYSHSFTAAGTYVYYCTIHGYAAMHGTVTISGSAPPPAVTAVVPNGGPTRGGNTVVIDGSGFVAGATSVTFGITTSTKVTFVSSTQLKAVAPRSAAGTVNVSAITAAGTSAATNASLYAYGPPVVSGLSPNAGSTAGGNVVRINGSGFVPGATVKFGTTAATGPITFVSPTELQAVAPKHAKASVHVVVTTKSGKSASAAGNVYKYS